MRRNLRLLIVGGLLLAGCSPSPPPVAKPVAPATPATSAPTTYVGYTAEPEVRDRLIFAWHEDALFVQTPASDETAREHYLRTGLPASLAKLLEQWQSRGQNQLEMQPGGKISENGPLAFTLHHVTGSANRAESWTWYMADAELEELLAALKSAAIAEEFLVTEPPGWVSQDDRVRNDFFGTGAPR